MWNLDWSIKCEVLAKAAAELNLISDIKRDIPKFGTVFTQTRATYGEIGKQNSNFHKLELWAKSINDFGNFERHFPCTTSAKILAAKYARVPPAITQFILKIENGARLRSPSLIMAPGKKWFNDRSNLLCWGVYNLARIGSVRIDKTRTGYEKKSDRHKFPPK